MRILLVGEYSRLHNSLKEGLQELGHELTIVGSGDAFKNYPVDILMERGYEQGWRKKLKVGIYTLTKIDISAIALRRKFNKLKPQLKGYDVVQLINESSFRTSPKLELEIAQYLKQHNKKLFLLSCGTDTKSVSYSTTGKLPYSILTPLQQGKGDKSQYEYALKYTSQAYIKLHKQLQLIVQGVIATDLDYHLPYAGVDTYLGLIPNPINTDKITYHPLEIKDRIIIFQGINRNNYFPKGQDIFTQALAIVKEQIPEKVEIISTENLPYEEYMKTYSKCHILLDQVYSLDQGYNALEAMARGKVVFTGAGELFIKQYNLDHKVAIDATPDAVHIANSLMELVNNPEKIKAISKNARKFIENHHNYIAIAQQYIQAWKLKERKH